jgi:hypothetical protein
MNVIPKDKAGASVSLSPELIAAFIFIFPVNAPTLPEYF